MTRKRFVKKMMAVGFSRNDANRILAQRGNRPTHDLWHSYLYGELHIAPVITEKGKRRLKRFSNSIRYLEKAICRSAFTMTDLADSLAKLSKAIGGQNEP